MAVVASATGAAVFGLSGVAAGVAGGALLGAGAGALYSGITGDGNILNSALTGGLLGAGAGGLGAAFAPAAAGTAAGASAAGAGTAAASGAAPTAATLAANAPTPALASSIMSGSAPMGSVGGATVNALGESVAGSAAPFTVPSAMNTGTGLTSGAVDAALQEGLSGPGAATSTGLSGKEMLGYGLAGTAALSLLGGMNQKKIPTQPIGQNQPMIRPYTYSAQPIQSAYPTTPQYGSNGLPILPTSEQRYFNQSYTAGTPYNAANGGLMAAGPVERMSRNVMGGLGNMYPQSQQEHTNFATPTQMPASAEIIRSDYDARTDPYTGVMMAGGGVADAYNLGSYSDGGRLLKGPGDGVSDDIPAVIGNKQPARLADGEFVVPARIVSELGNGSTDAGAKRLYAMMDRIQSGRKKTVGKEKVAVDTKSEKHLPA